MKSFKIIGLFLLILTIVTNNDAFSQKKKKKKSDDEYYTVPRSEYMMMENGKIYPIEDYSYDYDSASEEWSTWSSNSILPEILETEDYVLRISAGDSFLVKINSLTENGYQEVNRKLLNDEKRYGKYFNVKDTCITLKLANGTKSYYYPGFMDSLTPMLALIQNQELKPRWHYFEGYIKHLDAYLISWIENTSFYETKEGYLLVSAKDGSEIPFGGGYFYESLITESPIISIDNKQILLIKNTGIRIFSNENGHFNEKINVLFFDEYIEWNGYIIDAKWESENSFLLYVYSMDSESHEYVEQYKRVTINKK